MVEFYSKVPKTLAANLEYRIALRRRAQRDRGVQRALLTACKEDPLYWMEAFVYVYEPRPRFDSFGRKLPQMVPLILWSHQIPIVKALRDNLGLRDIACLAGDTLVLTDRGPVPITEVKSSDRIWDGVEFVTHGGVVSRGKKRTILAYGVRLTPDHLVLTTKGWRDASERHNRAAVRTPDGYPASGIVQEQGRKCSVAVSVRLRKRDCGLRKQSPQQETRNSELRLPDGRGYSLSPTPRTVPRRRCLQKLEWHDAEVQQSELHGLLPLGRTRNHGLRALALVRELLGGYGRETGPGVQPGSDRQRRELRTGQRAVGNVEDTEQQQKQQPLGGYAERHHDRCRSGQSSRCGPDDDVRQDLSRVSEGEDSGEEVFDIINCGPRNRFVVLGDAPTIVHNCEKGRGEGVSWLMVLMALHGWLFEPMSKVGLVSRNEQMADDPGNMDSILQKGVWALEKLPLWMRGEEGKDWLRNKTDHSLVNLRNGSQINAFAATAESGRAGRYKWFGCDELAFWQAPKDSQFLASVRGSTDCRFCVSTPNGPTGAFADFVHRPSNALRLRMHWSQNITKNRGLYRFVDGKPKAVDPENPLPEDYDPPSKDVLDLFSRLREKGFKLEGKDRSPWYDNECDRADSTPISIAQELDIDYGGSSFRVFGTDFFDAANKYLRDPEIRGLLDFNEETLEPEFHRSLDGPFLLWTQLDGKNKPPKRQYVVSADIGSGGGGSMTSNSVLEVIDVEKGEQVMEWATNTTEPTDFADYGIAVAKWFHNAKLAWETGGPGLQFGKRVLERQYSNIYRRTVWTRRRKKKTEEAGWASTKQSKQILVQSLQSTVKSGKLVVHSGRLVEEAHHFVYMNGSIEVDTERTTEDQSSKGVAHGDRVISIGVGNLVASELKTAPAKETDELKEPPTRYCFAARQLEWEKRQRAREDDWDSRSNWDLALGGRWQEN